MNSTVLLFFGLAFLVNQADASEKKNVQPSPYECLIRKPQNRLDRPDAKMAVFVKISGLPNSPGGIAKTTFVDGKEFSATLTVDAADRTKGLQILDIDMNNKLVFRVEFQREENRDSYYVYPEGFSIICQPK